MPASAACRHLSTPWFCTPGSLEPGVQVFAVGDVHGRHDAFLGVLQAIASAPRRAERRILVLLGNLVGKGPDSFGCLDLAMEARTLARVDGLIALPGSQEIMMAQAILDPEAHLERWALCGGQVVLEEAGVAEARDNPALQAEGVGAWLPFGWAEGVRDTQGWWQNGDVLCVHAGIHPQQDRVAFLRQPAFSPRPHHWAWMGTPFLSWPHGWDPDRRQIVVHGHSPVMDRWVGAESDMALFTPLAQRRLALDAGSGQRAQIAWAEMVGARARVGCIQQGKGDRM